MKAITALVAGVPLLMSFLNAQEGGAKRPLVAFVGTFSSPLHNVRPTQVDLPPGNGRGIHLISRAPIGPIASPSPGPSTHAPSGPEAAPEAPYEEDSEFLRRRKRSWARLISKVWLDPALCRSCQKPMKIIACALFHGLYNAFQLLAARAGADAWASWASRPQVAAPALMVLVSIGWWTWRGRRGRFRESNRSPVR